MTVCDFLVVGHGIAGATLAYVLRQRGHHVLVYDPGQDNSASNVAAGLMNPVAGKRFALSWRAAELLPYAATFYRELEQRYGQPFFTETPILKLFASLEEQNAVLARSADHPWGDFVAGLATTDPNLPGVHAPFGGAWLRHGGHVAVRELLAALAAEGARDGWLRRETFDWNRLVTDAAGATYAGQVRARQVICCEGAAAVRNPYFGWLPLTPNQGEVLDVECAGLSTAQVLNRGAYVVPVGPAQFRVGATYRWPPFAEGITAVAREELAARLTVITDLPFAVVRQQAGVRPAVRDRRPLLGPHPTVPSLSFCGGYGSKGVMLAPRLAQLLADWLEGHGEIWLDAGLERYHALLPASVI
ncbi:FAD-binding oxidoreductase [Hymenobacter sp. BT770]|uniref:NAD(P)/FAD-dependent oxidoreductase n=1 Tax=Hymenobacter sp. BT770 TaxID=2886942 RepID=UPI001D10629E|nr:FAD-binding oxidoreductase [Hymenobacter sp. BT770]MCC3151503.1 FAD-binding oxidoreductase [Hymenobacter sp. BT770]MDO3413921.1 FAD-binding oxidoreductase [Hymenobacter sp. BT770]